MDREEFRASGRELVDWLADYLYGGAERFPVRSRSRPGELLEALPAQAPEQGEAMGKIFEDFQRLILPGITHWNHPRFFAYFPANNSGPSVLGELLSAGLGVNGMLWETSPAATELEQRVMTWLAKLLDLSPEFQGAIQDSASTATLCGLLCARERATAFQIDRTGFTAGSRDGALRVYASEEAHSSVAKGARIAGFGASNVVAVPTDEALAMDVEALARLVLQDRQAGLRPCCVVATVGSTSTTALDPLGPIGELCEREGLWLHVDAALAGSAALLPELRWILDGVERSDSFAFNPHKWLFTNFDCSAFWTRSPEVLNRTFAIHPEYLRTERDGEVVNYRDWSVQLGRRFRALKLWFVLRSFGAEGLRARIRAHLKLARELRTRLEEHELFEPLAPTPLNTVCFRYAPAGRTEDELERDNALLLKQLNDDGRIYLTHTRVRGRYALRMAIGQTNTTGRHLDEAWGALVQTAQQLASGGV